MAYGLPEHGELDWDDKLLNSISVIKDTADDAHAKAVVAEGTANAVSETASTKAAEALNTANALGASVGQPNGIAPLDAAGLLPEANVPSRLTAASLSATYVAPAAVAAGAGIDASGVADSRTALQAKIDAVNAFGGGEVVVPRGIYQIGSTLVARDNVTLRLMEGAYLRRGYSGAPMVSNADLAAKVTNFKIIGPGKIGSDDFTTTGQVIFLYGDDIVLDGFTIDTYAGGQAVLIGGDRNRLAGLTIVNPQDTAGVGGIRMYGGSWFRAIGCHVESGDDALMFTPIATVGSPVRDLSISDSAYIGCTGGSTAARFMVVPISTSSPGTGGLTCSVTNVSFIGCHGFGSLRGIVIANTDSTGEIANVGLLDCSVNMTGAGVGGGQDVRVERGPGAGRVRDIRFQGLRVINPVETAIGTSGDATAGEYVEDVALLDCLLEAPADGGSTVSLTAVDGLTVRGGRIDGAGAAHVLTGGTGVNASRRVLVDGVKITGIGDGWAGIRLSETLGYAVHDSIFEPVPGATTAAGVSLAAGTSRGLIDGCDFSALPGAGVTGTVSTGTLPGVNHGQSFRAAGAGTIANGATAKAITHGLGYTPTSVTLGQRTSDAIWVSARNAVTFTVSRVGTTGTLDFDWSAIYQP